MRRPGWTLLELMLSLGIIALLISLLIPAVQAIREASRRTECQSRLRQMGIAIGNYESVHRMFPPGDSRFGFHVELLPYLDQAELHRQIWAVGAGTGSLRPVPFYTCPSDPGVNPVGEYKLYAINYAGNFGSGVLTDGYNGLFRHTGRPATTKWREGSVRVTDVTDGLSRTAAVSEILRADGTWHQLRVNWNLPEEIPMEQADLFAKVCQKVPRDASQHGWMGAAYARGMSWTSGEACYTWYNHVLPPQRPSCYNGDNVQQGIATAASAHKGGVNVVYADGHVEFASEFIDAKVWSEIGSRSSKKEYLP